MEKFRCEASQSKASLLKDMERKLEETRSQAETYENEAVLLSELLDKVKTGSDTFYFLLTLFNALLRFLITETKIT